MEGCREGQATKRTNLQTTSKGSIWSACTGKLHYSWDARGLTTVEFMLGLLERDPDLYLDEISKQLHLQHNLDVSVPTVWRTLIALGLSRKKVNMILSRSHHAC
jgi:hypothetical protein